MRLPAALQSGADFYGFGGKPGLGAHRKAAKMSFGFHRNGKKLPSWTPRRLAAQGLCALLICSAPAQSASTKLDREEGIGQIVRPATGTDRAVYAPLDRPVILPQFVGTWATQPGKCLPQSYKNRMELRPDLAIVAGHAYTLRATFVNVGLPADREGDEPLPASEFSGARDMLTDLSRAGEGTARMIHFHFSDRSGRLILEEVGKPRMAYVRCKI